MSVNECVKFFSEWSLIREDTEEKKCIKLKISWDGVEKKRQEKEMELDDA